jgi:ribosomal protein S18 acetylase RimI-like enzyme
VHSEDLRAVADFLRGAYHAAGSINNWLPQRFENSAKGNEADIRVWEDEDRIVAVANPEERLRYYLQVHPDYTGLEEEMLCWIESHAKGGGTLSITTLEGNPTREELLRRRGYARGKIDGILRLRDPQAPIHDGTLPDGFKIRSVDPSRDLKELSAAVRTVFGHGEWLNEDVLRELTKASFYRGELDLLVEDSAGVIACFCTFRVDARGGLVELEPMGTLPQFRGLGLAKALLSEGFRRVRRYNPKVIYIDGAANNPAANRLYEETGFTTRRDYYMWNKTV